MNKLILTTLTILFCAEAQSNIQYPELTHNHDSLWRANIEELRSNFKYMDGDPFARYANGENLIYKEKNKTPISLSSINKPTLDRFVKAVDYIDSSIVNYLRPKDEVNAIYYILKDRIKDIKSKSSMLCEYNLKLTSYHNSEYYYNSIKSFGKYYLEFTSNNGYNIKQFVDQNNLQGFIKDKQGYDSGSIKVLIKGRIVHLSLFDCHKDQGKDQIIKDLTEWAELLIKANK